jgi:exosortase/archaeosortase family protein
MFLSISLLSIYHLLNSYNLYQKITYPIQLITINIIHFLQNLFGIEVVINNFSLLYNNSLNVEISPICTGIEQLIFFFFMLSFFVGVDFKTKIKGFLFFAPIIIITNFLRLFLIYPLSIVYSIETTWKIHDFIFIYGQGFFLLILVLIWYYFFVNRQ